jgi:PAS domain S-box-containing protein
MTFSPAGWPIRRILFLLTGQVLFLLIIGGAVTYQVRWVNQKINEMADLKDPSPFTASLMNTLNTINLNLVGYLQNRDPLLEEALKASEKELETGLQDFHQQNPRLFPESAQVKIMAVYTPYKTAVEDTLRIGGEQAQKWEALLANDDDMMFWLEHRLRPIVRDNQPDSTERLNLILNLEGQLRSIPKDLTEYVLTRSEPSSTQVDKNSQNFTALIHDYGTIAKAVNERKNLAALERLWTDNVALAQDIVTREKSKRDAFSKMMLGHLQLQSTIREILPAVRPEVIEEQKHAILHSITLILVMAGALVLGGIGSLISSGLWGYRRIRKTQRPGIQNASAKEIKKTRELEKVQIGIGLDGRIVRWEPRAEHLYGYRASEIEGKSMSVLFGSADEIQRVSHELQEHKEAAFDTTHRRKNGSTIPVHVVFSPVTDPQGKMASLSLIATERAA